VRAKGGGGDALRPISGLPNIDRPLARRAISPRLGAFRGPLIAAITVIIDLLRWLGHQAAIAGPLDPRARVAGYLSVGGSSIRPTITSA